MWNVSNSGIFTFKGIQIYHRYVVVVGCFVLFCFCRVFLFSSLRGGGFGVIVWVCFVWGFFFVGGWGFAGFLGEG